MHQQNYFRELVNKASKPESKSQPKSKPLRSGNFKGYYQYRFKDSEEDNRVLALADHWFTGKRCWDIGCNSGDLTITITKKFQPAFMLGTDVDSELIQQAKRQLEHAIDPDHIQQILTEEQLDAVPLSFHGKHPHLPSGIGLKFPYNVSFRCENVVTDSHPQAQYDVITCFSVTKWIHLLHGDEGIKTLFQVVYDKLLPGGLFILEFQKWKSYHNRKFTSKITEQHYNATQFYPREFVTYLVNTVGFRESEQLQNAKNQKGFRRPIYKFTK